MDDKTRLIYQAALDRYLSAKFLQKLFRALLTTQYIYPTALRRRTFPLLSILNLVCCCDFGTLSQSAGAWGSMPAKHGSRLSPTTPWNSNGESPWNILEERLVNPWFVIHDSRLVHQNSCSSVRCSCSRCSSPSPSTGLCSCHRLSQVNFAYLWHIFSIYINHLPIFVTVVTGFFKFVQTFF